MVVNRGLAVSLASLISLANAQGGPYGNASTTATPASAGLTFGNAEGYSTKTYNATGPATTFSRQTDFSDQALAFLWDQVGPVSTGPVTTTVQPTPEPSVFPQPGAFHPLVPSYDENLNGIKLPANFEWGVASSAYQIEGAANAEGKGPSIWDLLAHRVPNQVADNTTGDVVASHYYLYKQDIARLKALGVPAFSFSFSWPRIFPFGHGPVNELGVQHYDDVVSEAVNNGLKLALTLFHWDTPLALFNEYGAWTDEQIVDDFFNYAKFIISRYDQYVTTWFTINEPQYCNWQYSYYPAGKYYPAYNNITGGLPARFICGHYSILAHAKVAKWYHEEFKGKGRITFKNSGNYYEANSTSQADQVSAQRNFDFSIGWFGGPWTDGDYPQTLKDTLGDLLPTLSADEKAMIKGSCDFYALDGYTSFTAYGIDDFESCVNNRTNPGYPECAGSGKNAPDGFPLGPQGDIQVNWLSDTPGGIRRYLNFITKELFPSIPDIMVSEFGFAVPFESQFPQISMAVWDLARADYYQSFLDNILGAMVYDKVNVTGAWGWAIFDNLEWSSGLIPRFGLQYVNYTDLSRTPKASMFQLVNWFKEHGNSGSSNTTMKLL